jgi:hypothetical protein
MKTHNRHPGSQPPNYKTQLFSQHDATLLAKHLLQKK